MRFALTWLWAMADAAYCDAYWQQVAAAERWLTVLLEALDE